MRGHVGVEPLGFPSGCVLELLPLECVVFEVACHVQCGRSCCSFGP